MIVNARRILAAGAAAVGAGAATLALAAVPATAAGNTTESASENWAGYIAQGKSFSAVSGSWVQPSAQCNSGEGYSAFWVGLGGASGQSQALEQVGTQADCSSTGNTSYYAWYELVPAAPVRLDVAVKPGDHLSARVSVSGSNVTVNLADDTTGKSVTKTVTASAIDTSSAEWIAEAPSACSDNGDCQPLPLADFGTVKFSHASATAGGRTGAISAWSSQAVQLSGSGGSAPLGIAYAPSGSGSGSAQTSALSSGGGAFSVAWQSPDAQAASVGGGSPAGGYGSGAYGPGAYGDGSGVYGDGSGAYGDGSGGYAYAPGGAYGPDGYGYGAYGGSAAYGL